MTEASGGIDPLKAAQAAQAQQTRQESSARRIARQVECQEDLQTAEEEMFNPMSPEKYSEFKSLRDRRPTEKAKEEAKERTKQVHTAEDKGDTATFSERDNPELRREDLQNMLRAVLARGGGPEELLEEVLRYFSDPSLADEALEWLEAQTEGETRDNAIKAREILNERLGREVRAGRNMGPESRIYSAQGLGSPNELRDMYRDITGNPREQNALFKELSDKYSFEQLKAVIEFLFESLGADLRSKGPSISRGELYRLITETRVLQAILGVYYFFKEREKQVKRRFREGGRLKPDSLTFEALAEEFMALVEERYPTAMKALNTTTRFEIGEDPYALIIILEQFRDAIRQVAPRIYRSLKHRYDLLAAILESLEELENELEEQEEEEEEEEE